MSWLWGKKTQESVAVVDIRSSSISAGYVFLKQGTPAHIVHSVHFPIDTHATEPLSEAMPRTLTTVLTALTTEGSAKLLAHTGRGKVDKVLVTITSPWQQSTIRSVSKSEERPFTFTKGLLEEITEGAFPKKEGRKTVSELVISTFLNGYETSNPFGRSVKEVQVLSLSTDIDEEVYTLIRKTIKEAFHQSHIDVYAFMPELYAVTRDLFPHQRDYLVLDVGNTAIDVLLVKHGLLVDLPSSTHGMSDILNAVHGSGVATVSGPLAQDAVVLDTTRNASFESNTEQAKAGWIHSLKETLSTVAEHEPLPRLVFVLSEENVSEFLKRLLDAPELRSLWLSEESLTIFSVLASQFGSHVTVAENTTPSVPLYFLALAANKRYTVS
jgi:hypothetical protein